jgi:thiol-disulfide isomerase/thioredoxin
MRTTIVSLLGATVLFTGSAAEPARPGPAFSIMRIGTAPLKLSQYRGKVVALAFIYTTCPHCQRLTTILNSVAKDYSARGVQVLECAFNEDAVPTMPEFLKKVEPQFPVGRTCNTRSPIRGWCMCRTWCFSTVPARYAATIRARAASSSIRTPTSGRNWIRC